MERIPVHPSVNPLLVTQNYTHQNAFQDNGSKPGKRNIFYNTEFTTFEKQKLAEFLQYLDMPQRAQLKSRIPSNYPLQEYLKNLYAGNFKFKKATEFLKIQLDWRQNYMPYGFAGFYKDVVKEIVQRGVIYIHGRDILHQPVVIYNFPDFDFKKGTQEDYVAAIVFIHEYAIQYLFQNGKIEQWIVLIDFAHLSLYKIGFGALKHVCLSLMDNFTCRLSHCFMVNCPTSAYIFWKILTPFLDNETSSKIHLHRISNPPELLSQVPPDQLEKRFGGAAENVEVRFPPTIPGMEEKIVEFQKEQEMKKQSKQIHNEEKYTEREDNSQQFYDSTLNTENPKAKQFIQNKSQLDSSQDSDNNNISDIYDNFKVEDFKSEKKMVKIQTFQSEQYFCDKK